MRPLFLSVCSFLRSLIACLLICLVSSAAMPVVASGQPKELLLGIEPEHNIFDQVERYRYLADYLSDQLGVKVKLTITAHNGEFYIHPKLIRKIVGKIAIAFHLVEYVVLWFNAEKQFLWLPGCDNRHGC